MKRVTKKLLAVAAVMAVLCMTLTGCGSKMAPADETVGALFELAAKDNTAPMKQLLGFDSDEAVRSAFFEEGSDVELAEEMKGILTDAGVEMTDEDIQELSDSMASMLNKITYTAEITSSDKDTTVVTLKVNGYQASDLETVMMDAMTSMQESLTEEDSLAIVNGDTELFTAYMKSFLNDFLNGLNELEVSSEPVEMTVNCEKLAVEVNDKAVVAWLPSDMTDFSEDVENAIFH
ncbi:MAG: hypothetical protein NC429_12605 [Lachnospiraceae bacterium]|nr:hypothetical protein [Lachnospiraceae bacterium]